MNSTRFASRRVLISLGSMAALAVAATPATAEYKPELLPSTTSTLVAKSAKKMSCVSGIRKGRNVAKTVYTAQADGYLTAHLRGSSRTNDWDLGLFRANGELVDNEVAKGFMRRGEKVTIQACRRSGRDRSMSLRTSFAKIPVEVGAVDGKVQLVDVKILNQLHMEMLVDSGLDVTHNIHDGHAQVMLYGDKDLGILKTLGFPFRVEIADMVAQFRKDRAADRAYTKRVGRSPLPSGRTEYRTLEDIQADLKKLTDSRPDIVKPFAMTQKSFEGRDLTTVEIAANVNAPADGRPYFILNGIHHAREWPGSESPVEFAIDLVNGYGKDPRITELLKKVRVLVTPLTNIDGYVNSRSAPVDDPDGTYTATNASPGPGANAYRRKTCQFPYPNTVPCEFQIGVDPNRNYGESWGGPGASSNPQSLTWRGPSPFSEPETQAVREQVSMLNATMLIAMHNVAALVLRPPGLEADGFAPDEERLKFFGDQMGETTGYESQYGWQLYDTTGTTDDYSYAATGAYGYTIEMGPPSGNFHGNYEEHVVQQYDGDAESGLKGLREAFLIAAEAAVSPQDTSRIAGRAPAGRTLRIKKTFETETYAVCTVADPAPVGTDDLACQGQGEVQKLPEKIEFTMTVPASGRFEWWVNPSTRPFDLKAGKKTAYTLTCEDGAKVVETKEVIVDRGQTLTMDLPCGGTLVEDVKAPVTTPGTPTAPAKGNSGAAKAKAAYKKCLKKASKKKGKAKKKAQSACKKAYKKALKKAKK
jgi:hypothetical protein